MPPAASYVGSTDLPHTGRGALRCDGNGGPGRQPPEPAAADVPSGYEITVKDEGDNAGVYNITIDGDAAETIDGASDITIDQNGDSYTVYSDGTSAWFTK